MSDMFQKLTYHDFINMQDQPAHVTIQGDIVCKGQKIMPRDKEYLDNLVLGRTYTIHVITAQESHYMVCLRHSLGFVIMKSGKIEEKIDE